MAKKKQQNIKLKRRIKKKKSSLKEQLLDKIRTTKPILMFWGGFLLLISLYFLISFSTFYTDYILIPVSTIYTELSSIILNVFGQNTSTSGVNISNPDFSISVRKGCDGIAATIFYLVCVLLFPATRTQKWRGVWIGVTLLSLLNLVRVVSLFLIGRYVNDWFDFMHVEFWQVAYVAAAIFIYGTWLYWVFNQNKTLNNAEAT